MVDIRLIAYLGLLLGNIARQLLPFLRKYFLEEELKAWDKKYTKRFLLSVILALGATVAAIPGFTIPLDGILDVLWKSFILGVTENFLVDEGWKWIAALREPAKPS